VGVYYFSIIFFDFIEGMFLLKEIKRHPSIKNKP